MARPRKPWFRKSTKCWYIEVDGKQVNLGPHRKEAHQRFHALMAEPDSRLPVPRTTRISLVEVVEHFLEWVQGNRADATYQWYQHRLQRLCRQYPDTQAQHLKPYMVQEWVNGLKVAVTTQRNYLRCVKRCLQWARAQGYIS